ncbi:MAG: hypothetical protein AAGI28_02320 [Pseudomonadota bacterium]
MYHGFDQTNAERNQSIPGQRERYRNRNAEVHDRIGCSFGDVALRPVEPGTIGIVSLLLLN